MFEKTFESLLKGLDPKSEPKSMFPPSKKIDLHARGLQYYNAEKEFIQSTNEIDSQMRLKVSQLKLTKNPIQPYLNEVFIRKPKRQVDKSALNDDARTGFVDLFGRVSQIWEHSESKKNAISLFGIGEAENNNNQQGVDKGAQGSRRNHLLRVLSKDSTMTQSEDLNSPVIEPTRKAFGNHLTVESHALQRNASGEPTPILNKEDSFDTSAHFHALKPPQSLTQIIASREVLDKDDHEEQEEKRKTDKRLQSKIDKENKEKEREIEREKERERERQRLEEESTNKKVEVWMQGIPDFGFLFANEVVEPKAGS